MGSHFGYGLQSWICFGWFFLMIIVISVFRSKWLRRRALANRSDAIDWAVLHLPKEQHPTAIDLALLILEFNDERIAISDLDPAAPVSAQLTMLESDYGNLYQGIRRDLGLSTKGLQPDQTLETWIAHLTNLRSEQA